MQGDALRAAVKHDASDLSIREPAAEPFQCGPRLGRHGLTALDLDGDQPAVAQLEDEIDLEAVGIAEVMHVVWLCAPSPLFE